jgi:6-bladed beta-propeller
MVRGSIRTATLLGVAIAAACGDPAISDGPWVAETTHLGDTTVVQTVSGSAWGRPARLVEEIRLGTIEAGEATSFGELSQVAVAEDGSMFLFDPQVPQLYRFDATGELIGLIGRQGQGPGEYERDVTGMIVTAGRVIVADADNYRMSAFSLDGAYLESLGPVSGLRSMFSPAVAAGPDEGFALPVLMVVGGPGVEIPEPWPIGLEIRGPGGDVLDTIPPQSLVGGHGRLLAGQDGDAVVVTSPTEFLFELRRTNGEVLRVRMPFERAEYSEAEERMLGRALAPAAAADGESEVDLPALKDTYLEYLCTPGGRVWARRPVADRGGEPSWRFPRYQPSVMDVFDVDGSYLGVVPLPTNSRPVVVTDSYAYVVELGSYDEPYLVRYRVEVPH